MHSKLASWCEGIIEAGILVSVIAAPLFFNIHSDRVFEPDKLTLVRSLAVLMATAWLVAFLDREGWRDLSWLSWRAANSVWRKPLVLPVSLLALVYLLATAFSVVPRTSLAGSYQRLQGTYTTLSYIVIFALAVATLDRREKINRLVTTIIITSIPIALYGLLQHYGLDPLPWGGNTQRRIAGHMGNAIFIAAYLIMVVPLTAVRVIDAFTNILGDEELSYADVVRSSVYIFALAIQIVAIYWSGSRGPWLGLLVGIFTLGLILLVSLRNAAPATARMWPDGVLKAFAAVILGPILPALAIYLLLRATLPEAQLAVGVASFAAFIGALGIVVVFVIPVMALARRGWRWLWLSWLLAAGVIVLWISLFNVPAERADDFSDVPVVGDVFDTLATWREIPTIGRFGRLLEADQGTGRVRVLIWEGALELLKPHEPLVYPGGGEDTFNFLRPLLGYGPESMYVAYNRFYVPELATIEARNASPDRSHNETFDALIITGVAGYIAWQVLYLSVFYFGFSWLGVVRRRHDRNLLVAFWVGGAAVGAIAITELLGAVFLGVAIPFGSIIGLVLYLGYYALFGSMDSEGDGVTIDPFQADRLLLIGLLAAVVAHYVEIHFGIAVAATRVHFFVYVALMVLVGYVLPRAQPETMADNAAALQAPRGRRTRRRTRATGRAWTAPVLAMTIVLAVIIGTLGYEFMNYAQPPGQEITTLADVPTAGQILHQAFFVNPKENFINSPFIFLVIVMTWALGVLISLSEMVKQDLLKPLRSTQEREKDSDANKRRLAGIIFSLLLVAGWLQLFLGSGAQSATMTSGLGRGLLLMWSALCLWALYGLFVRQRYVSAGIIAAVGFAFSLPVIIAGAAFYGLLLAGGCLLILYFIWDVSWSDLILPGIFFAGTAFIIGFAYAYLQALQIRDAVFFGPPQALPAIERILFSADKFARFLTAYYGFIIVLVLFAGFVLARRKMAQTRHAGSVFGFVAAALLFTLALFFINRTNLRVIQADMVYKQARPLDNQATRSGNPDDWDIPIAIYEHAIDLAPVEDFYYLFLGRAYLEKSAVVQDPVAQRQLLETAEDRLLVAQELNPLNTDHTANLARLLTRWASLTQDDPAERERLLAQAKTLYLEALDLSPQNSVIRNEYANLLASLENDCDGAIATYEKSLEIDPYFANSYFSLAGVYELCAGGQAQEQQLVYYRRGAELLLEGLEQQDQNAGSILLQAGQLFKQAGDYESALNVLERAREQAATEVPAWLIDFREAQVYQQMGDLLKAQQLASRALDAAPSETQEEIQALLDELQGK